MVLYTKKSFFPSDQWHWTLPRLENGSYCLSLLGYCLEVECAECIAAQQLRAPADTTTLRGVKQAALGNTNIVSQDF